MKKGLLTVMALGMFVFACPPNEIDAKPDQVLQKDQWVLKVWVTAKGTRSEGHIAHLYHKGKEVCPIKETDELNTPLGKLKYINGSTPWDWHGWKVVKKRLPLIKP